MRRSYKRYVAYFAGCLAAFVGMNLLIWIAWTEDLLTDHRYVAGDLTRMGYILGSKMCRTSYCDLPHRHIEWSDYAGEKIDLLTIGDSFSSGGGGGKNRYYQDYIASFNRLTVLNVHPEKGRDAITSVAALANSGTLDRLKPRFVLIESSQKFCIDDFAKQIDFAANISPGKPWASSLTGDATSLPAVPFMNDGNFKFLLYNLLYPFSDHAFVGKVCGRALTKDLFTVENGAKLLFLRDEIKRIPRATPEAVALMNRNLNTLAEKLAARGIKLYFMPCVDKYTLYCDYLVQNPYPRSTFFEELRKLPKKYNLIDTKEVLAEELKKGVKDIFYADDTHWSWKAPEAIFGTQLFK